MSTLNDLDLGPSHSWLATRIGQVVGQAFVEGNATAVWPRGRIAEEQPTAFYVNAWQALGGSAANTRQALLYLLRQLEELAGNPDMQPLFIGWTTTAFPSAPLNAVDGHDGWYVISQIQPPYRRYVVTGGTIAAPGTAVLQAPATPSSLAARWSGGVMPTNYPVTPIVGTAGTNLVPFPVGSTLQAPTALSRTGAEGAIPISLAPVPNPVPFTRPSTVAGMFTGRVKAFDTLNTGANAVPTNGAFVNANWVRVYGTQHDFVGDLVITNGLLLLVFQVTAAISVYVWNTSLSPAAWQFAGNLNYNDNAFAAQNVRELNLERVGLDEVRARIVLSTANGNYAELRWKLQSGSYGATVEFWPRTQANSINYGLRWALNAAKIGYNDAALADLAVTANASLGAGGATGFATAFSNAANGPLVGILYQNLPSTSQGIGGSLSTDFGFGDSSGPAAGAYRRYGIFAMPFGSNGASVEKLQAEGESGALGTGWSSVADAAASNGNAAKAASGTVAANADLFGTAWVPPAGQYDVWARVRVASNASSTNQMQIGLWDTTAGAFVQSITIAPNSFGGSLTSYQWFKCSIGVPSQVTPTAAHNMQFRAVTTATLTTDWFIDEMVLAPVLSASLGFGNFPADIWSQWLFDKSVSWSRG